MLDSNMIYIPGYVDDEFIIPMAILRGGSINLSLRLFMAFVLVKS